MSDGRLADPAREAVRERIRAVLESYDKDRALNGAITDSLIATVEIALADAGYEVGRWEVAYYRRKGTALFRESEPASMVGWEPVFRRVEGGATGEQTE